MTHSSPVTTDEISRLIAENIEVEAWETDGGSVASVSGIKEASEAILAALVRSGPAQRRGLTAEELRAKFGEDWGPYGAALGNSVADLPEFEDPRVQIVYELLCDIQQPPNPEEHWEGWNARRIVAALAPGNGAVEADMVALGNKLEAALKRPDPAALDPVTVEACAFIDEFMTHFGIGDHPSMSWKRTTCDDGLEMVHHDGDTIFFGDANHQDPDDIARFDLIVRLVNSLPAIRALIGQPARNAEPVTVEDGSLETTKALHEFATDYRQQEQNIEVLVGALETIVRAAGTAALLLRKDHPVEAATLRDKIAVAKDLLVESTSLVTSTNEASS